MFIPDTRGNLNQVAFSTLEKIRTCLGISLKAWAGEIGLTEKQYQWIASGKRKLLISKAIEISEKFNFSFEKILSGKIDLQTLAAHYQGNVLYVPEKYSIHAFSRKRSILNVVHYVQEHLGWNSAALLLKQFQIHYRSLLEEEGHVNILLALEMLKELRKWGVGDHFFINLGKYTSISFKNSFLGQSVKFASSVKQAYEIVFSYYKFYEENADYQLLKLTSTYCLLECVPKLDIIHAFFPHPITTHESTLYKIGVMQSIPSFLGLPAAQVKQVSSVLQGNASCIFEINFEEAVHCFNQLKQRGEE